MSREATPLQKNLLKLLSTKGNRLFRDSRFGDCHIFKVVDKSDLVCDHDLRITMQTLRSLQRKGLIELDVAIGWVYWYQLTPQGWRAINKTKGRNQKLPLDRPITVKNSYSHK